MSNVADVAIGTARMRGAFVGALAHRTLTNAHPAASHLGLLSGKHQRSIGGKRSCRSNACCCLFAIRLLALLARLACMFCVDSSCTTLGDRCVALAPPRLEYC